MTPMISSQRSPVWPYLLVLTALFLLSLAVPRGWQQESGSDEWKPIARHRVRQRASHSVAIVRPTTENIALPQTTMPSNDVAREDQWTAVEQPVGSADGPATNFIAPLAESVARKIADFRRFGAAQNAGPETAGPANIDAAQQSNPWTEQKSPTIASTNWPAP